jgi:nucleotide-binding universal stress UspA family protein
MEQAEPERDRHDGRNQPAPPREQLRRHEPVRDSAIETAWPLEHPVVAGYDGSVSARHALAYAAGLSRRLGRSLLVVYVASSGVYCEPFTGQVIGLTRDNDALERWLLAELDLVTDPDGLDVHIRTRRGNPAKELAQIACHLEADALVVGAPKAFWHQIAGSVPGWLARHASCPVVVVP